MGAGDDLGAGCLRDPSWRDIPTGARPAPGSRVTCRRTCAIVLRDCYGDKMNPELRERGYIPTKGLLEPSLAAAACSSGLAQSWPC